MDGALRNMTSLYLTRGGQMLLLYRVGSRVVSPSWCGIGGHFEREELNDARACMLRELGEEAGLREQDLDGLALRYVTLRRKAGEIRQNYYFFAALRDGVGAPSDCGEGILRWVPLADVLSLEMPFTARCVLAHYLQTGQQTNALYAGCATPDGAAFTAMEEF